MLPFLYTKAAKRWQQYRTFFRLSSQKAIAGQAFSIRIIFQGYFITKRRRLSRKIQECLSGAARLPKRLNISDFKASQPAEGPLDAIKHRSWVAAVHFHDHIAAVAPGFKPFQNFADANTGV